MNERHTGTRLAAACAAGLLLAAAAAPVLAGPPGPHGHGAHMAWLDSDGDGAVSRSEFDAGGKSRFAESDTDGDGQLSAEELEAAHERMREQMRSERAGRHQNRALARFDADGNGLVSREEFDAARAGLFEQLDADGDGVLRPDERPRWHEGRGGKAEEGSR